jgi:hypothetical protein
MATGTSVHIIDGLRIEVFDLADGDFCAQLTFLEAVYQALFSPEGEVLMLGGCDLQSGAGDGKMAEPTEELLSAMHTAVRERRYQSGLL